ncbi:MAG TPA: hypothetical protein VFK48_07560 [Usitatibacter sp.]|nr:hypothetical protein [Usitatibacter sp.]
MFKRLLLTALLTGLSFSFSFPAFAQADCSRLTGRAQGLCRAAGAIQCDGSSAQNPACTLIEEQYEAVTGEPAPWIACPCGTAREFVELAGTKDVACYYVASAGTSVLRLDRTSPRLGEANIVFSFVPGSFAIAGKQTCGFQNVSAFPLTDAEASSCIGQINQAANLLLTKCPQSP